MAHVGIIGGGASGTAMACALSRRGHEITIRAREAEVVESINHAPANPMFLRGVPLPVGIATSCRLTPRRRVRCTMPTAPHASVD